MGSVDGASVRNNIIVRDARRPRHRNMDPAAVECTGAHPGQDARGTGHPTANAAPTAGVRPTRSHALPHGRLPASPTPRVTGSRHLPQSSHPHHPRAQSHPPVT